MHALVIALVVQVQVHVQNAIPIISQAVDIAQVAQALVGLAVVLHQIAQDVIVDII